MAKDINGKELPKGITQRKDGRYMGRFEYKGEKFTFYNLDLKALIKEMKDKRYEVEHGLYCKESKLTVSSWFATWIHEYKENSVKYGTIKSYQDCFNQYIEPIFGKKKLAEIRPEHIQKLYNDMTKTYSKATISLVSIIFGGMFKQAVKNEIVQRNPVELATLPRESKKKEFRVLSLQEQKLFMDYAKASQYYDIYVIALNTGLRSGELRGLEWDDIDFKNRVIHVNNTLKYVKGKGYRKDSAKTATSTRDIPMLDTVYDTFKSYKLKQALDKLKLSDKWKCMDGLTKLVFTNRTGSPVSNMALNDDLKKIEKLIQNDGNKFDHIKPHTLRHTFATRGLEKGIPPKVMQELLGHTSITMTLDIYSHVLPDTKANELEKIANLF